MVKLYGTKTHHLILRVSCRKASPQEGNTVHSFDAATYPATPGATSNLNPENSFEVFLPARGFIIHQISKIMFTREFRRHALGRAREQEQEQALQPLQQHFLFLKSLERGGKEKFLSHFREAVVV